MIGARRWAIAGLLCVCGLMGCVQLPSRGLFARRNNPSVDDSRKTERSDRTDLLDEEASVGSESISLADGSLPSGSAGRLFGVSGRDGAGESSSEVEAPLPKRRGSVPPKAFVAAPNARELLPNSDSSPAQLAVDRGGVVLADYEAAARGDSSNVELVGGKRTENNTASDIVNPLDRFRSLTKRVDADQSTTGPTIDSTSANDPRNDQSTPQRSAPQRAEQNAVTNNFAGQPPDNRGDAQPTPWSDAFGPSAGANSLNESASRRNAVETWPRAPGTSGFNPAPNDPATNSYSSAGGVVSPGNWNSGGGFPTASNSLDVQRVNAEQPDFNNFSPTPTNPQSLTASGNVPLNSSFPDGVPLMIAPFSSSPELERLITQTTVEAAAGIAGDSETNRQLYLRKQVQLRLLHLIAGHTDRALQPIPGIDSTDQEFWQQMLWGMANYFDTQGMPDGAERATQTIAQLRAAATRLQEKARLELRNVAFCQKISGFGNYQRFKRDEFIAGQPVLLYAEVGDFKSEPTPDGQFRTLMKSTLEVLEGGPTGRLVESLPLTPSEDRCRNQRRDYYYSYEFVIPQSCNRGPHTLRLRVEDQLGKKTAVTTLNFTVE